VHLAAQERERSALPQACPTCAAPLAAKPFESTERGLRFDPDLDDLVRRLFPRPAVDAAAASRREARETERRREREERRAAGGDPLRGVGESDYYRRKPSAATLARGRAVTAGPEFALARGGSGHPSGSGARGGRVTAAEDDRAGVSQQPAIHVLLRPDDTCAGPDGRPSLPALSKPYWRVPCGMPVSCLSRALSQVLPGPPDATSAEGGDGSSSAAGSGAKLSCLGCPVDPRWTVGAAYETLWRPHTLEGALMVLTYRDESVSARGRRPTTASQGRGGGW